MRAIIVDDEPLMVQRLERLFSEFKELSIIGRFTDSAAALLFAKDNVVDVAFLDVEMPGMNGIRLAGALRDIRDDILIVFVTAHEKYISECNELGGDYYLLKPYTEQSLSMMFENLKLLSNRQLKDIYIQTFGRFVVKKDGWPIKLTGKAKEILALLVAGCGKEMSNEEIYSTIWEDRPYSNQKMATYFNALRRLRNSLKEAGLENLLISVSHGHMVNTEIFSCDYYAWKDNYYQTGERFEGEFLPEYSWGEEILVNILKEGKML